MPGPPQPLIPAPRLTVRLAEGVVDVDVHGAVQRADQKGLVGSSSLVGPVDGLGLPVGPVNEILKEGERKDVRDVLAQHCKGEWAAQKGNTPLPLVRGTEELGTIPSSPGSSFHD